VINFEAHGLRNTACFKRCGTNLNLTLMKM
jgi:hypothetical protein